MKIKQITYIIGFLCAFNAYAVTEEIDNKIKTKFPMATDIKELANTKNTYSFNIGTNSIITNSNFDYIYFDNDLYILNKNGEFTTIKNTKEESIKPFLENKKEITDITHNEQPKLLEEKVTYNYLAKNDVKPLLNNKDLDESLSVLLKETANNPIFMYKEGEVKASSVWDNLNYIDAFKQVYGNGENKVAVLTDPDCYYCQAFEKMLDENKNSFNVTIYKIPFFLNSHPNSPEKFRFIYSQPDAAQAYTDWMSYSIESDEKNDDLRWKKWVLESRRKELPIDEVKYKHLINNADSFIQKYKFRSTPTILFSNGVISNNGLLSAEEFELFLKFSEKSPNVTLPEELRN